jgi:hypothetical protein
MSFHQHYLTIVSDAENRFRVAQWRSGDVDLWPLARMDLYLDMYVQDTGCPVAPARSRVRRGLDALARPVTNIWDQRSDLRKLRLLPRRADAIFLGDGVSLDRIDGVWEDRFCEPVLSALEAQGRVGFLMQAGDTRRLPRRRPTYPANMIATAGHLLAPLFAAQPELPDHGRLLDFLRAENIQAPSLAASRLARRARIVAASAFAFEQILRSVRPKLAFAVTWYAGLGPAFMLACRRQGILAVDLQHGPQGGRHKAYGWSGVPARGFNLLPAVFWNWNRDDATHIASWAQAPWHRSLIGGHPRLDPLRDDDSPEMQRTEFRHEVLVALQTTGGRSGLWDRLADIIVAGPKDWRWWIRRHPAARPEDDRLYARLVALRGRNICVDAASLPLAKLLPRVSVVVSVASGVAVEASSFGIPAIFLSREASGPFDKLIQSDHARVVEDMATLCAAIEALPTPQRPTMGERPPPLAATLEQLEALAVDYKRACARSSEIADA